MTDLAVADDVEPVAHEARDRIITAVVTPLLNVVVPRWRRVATLTMTNAAIVLA